MQTGDKASRRVLYFASSHRIGLTALLTEKALALRSLQGYEFLYASGEKEQFPGLGKRLEDHGVRLERIQGFDEHKGFLSLVKRLGVLCEEFDPHVVHVQTNWQLALAATVKWTRRKRFAIVYTIYGYRHNHPVRSWVARSIIGLALAVAADKVLLTSTFLGNVFGLVRRKQALLFLGVDEEYFGEGRGLSTEGEIRIIFAGEFRKGKNQEWLVRAAVALRERVGGCFRIVLVGLGPNLEGCQALAKELDVEDLVDFPGFLSRRQLLDAYLESHIGVVPTNVETFGLCIAEPFVLGRIVVTRRVGVAEDVLVDGKNGFFFESETDLVDTLERLIKMDRSRWSEISKQALQDREVFRWSHIAQQYRQILDSIKV